MTPDQGDQHPRHEPGRGGSAAAIRAALTLPGAAGGLPHWGGRRPRRTPATLFRPIAAPPREVPPAEGA
ncbi:hypothetical protein [Nocardiopsis trehalosi]|jgi:hypothetical protein|uniref:hypothetical protein n=1 Tax=Nocardiopsis trehalosi TaxID=109329 RepID=UPI00082A5E5B|nr:hypothetical protein [Nocardiopsis trehalosi]